jgi:hypothetical protein
MPAKCIASARARRLPGDVRRIDRAARCVERAALVSAQPRSHRAEREARHAGVLAEVARVGGVSRDVVDRLGLLHMTDGRARVAGAQCRHRHRLVRLEHHRVVTGGFGHGQQLLRELAGAGQVGANLVEYPNAPKHRNSEGRTFRRRTDQVVRPRVDLLDLRRGAALGHLEVHAQRHE